MTTAVSAAQALLASALTLPVATVPEDGSMDTVPGWDSLNHFNVICELESKISRPLTSNEIVGLRCVQDIARILESAGRHS